MTEAEREAKIVAIRECAAWLDRTAVVFHGCRTTDPAPRILLTARRRLRTELERRADRLEVELQLAKMRAGRKPAC